MAEVPPRTRPGSLMQAALVLLAGALLAGASALAALERVQERNARADSATQLMTPGFALSHRVTAIIAAHAQISETGALSLPDQIADEARAISLAALAREPLDGAALRNLAILAQSAGEGAKARELLLLSEQVSRRDRQTNVLLAQTSAARTDLPATLARLDQALRTSSRARREIVPMLYDVLAQPGAGGVLSEMLAENVNWEADFWAGAHRGSRALPQLAQLRVERAQAGYGGVPLSDRRLLDALVKEQHFASAEVLFDVLHGNAARGGGAVRNGEFTRLPQAGAFDWDLQFDSGLSAQIAPSPGALHIATFSNGGGVAARQLVSLPGTQYRLRLKASDWDARDAGALRIGLRCAESAGAERSFAITNSVAATDLAKPAPDCIYHWLTIALAPQADRRDNSVTIETIALSPLAGR